MNSTDNKSFSSATSSDVTANIRLRNIEPNDLPLLYEFQLDPEANQLALTHPRSGEAFDEHWEGILCDSSVIVRAIEAGDILAGCISCFKCDGVDSIGYWIGKEFWGRGVATQALNLLLLEVPIRPLHARVAVSNVASIRVLEKCGFREIRRESSPATERYVECEEVVLKLRSTASRIS
ncbi:GNAT family N-acetyltransferase [Fuerstiella marisgermanici]|uniref:N-acetyltransferase domain-containing protein n=1 Tax=Fuerstiella marisgermanici TaxID=1891926 RepID=A0A1P8WGZ6_9PLAN|nr:hypothetical protein Fuma_02922 [Fuerstiella marisgermanici]